MPGVAAPGLVPGIAGGRPGRQRHHADGAVDRGEVDAGLLIHEGQITYAALGYHKILDFGELWHNASDGLPPPLRPSAGARGTLRSART